MTDQNWSAGRIIAGLRDTLCVWQEQSGPPETAASLKALEQILNENSKSPAELAQILDRSINAAGNLAGSKDESNIEFENWRKIFEQGCRDQREEILATYPWVQLQEQVKIHLNHESAQEFKKFWEQLNSPVSLRRLVDETDGRLAKLDELLIVTRGSAQNAELAKLLPDLRSLLKAAGQKALANLNELEHLAQCCDDLGRMDFTVLYDPVRELFSIGYNVSQHRLDTSCYDLLASEARLASYVAIALDQVEQKHWFRLGRSLTAAGGKPTLISWSGSMFEYLMPMLVMPSYENTLLDRSCKTAVERQIDYGKQIHVPWGISESGFNLRDTNANYQYRAFGVPGLGFKRGLAQDIVIAPYATVMALMVAPEAACRNLKALRHEKAEGKFGLYEALDYTTSRVPNGQTHAVVRSFMAHHQGMSLLSLAYLLLDRPMQRRFNSNPFFKIGRTVAA